MKTFIIIAAALLLFVAPVFAYTPPPWTHTKWHIGSNSTPISADPCINKTAPKGWLRPGGYCEISSRPRSLDPTRGGGGGTVCNHGCRLYDFDYGGWHYHDNGSGNWTVTNGSATFTYQYNSDGSHTRTPY